MSKAPNGTKIYQGSGVTTPRNIIAPPTMKNALGIEKSSSTSSFVALVIMIPVDKDISSDGI